MPDVQPVGGPGHRDADHSEGIEVLVTGSNSTPRCPVLKLDRWGNGYYYHNNIINFAVYY